nr:hypothetical protein CFP56_18538 [Quercus suber]
MGALLLGLVTLVPGVKLTGVPSTELVFNAATGNGRPWLGWSGGLLRTVMPSPAVSIEELPSPPWTRKGKEKKGEGIWVDPATTLAQVHNVISDDELKVLSSVPSHELVSRHVHKLMQQVLGESMRLTTDYLTTEEKVMMANSRVEATEAKSSRLRKDLIEAMDQDKEIQSTKLKVSDEHEKEDAEFQVSEAFGIITFDEFFKDFELL